MTSPMRLRDRVATVTGAASGIGRAVAVSLARRGCNLALADIADAGLAQTKRLASGDAADRRAVAAFPKAVLRAHDRVDLVINNAGVALGGTFEEVADEDFEWIEINSWAVVEMTRAFLPHLKASDDARTINLSSVFGLIAPPGQTAYAASKFAVRGFSNALMQELEGSSIGVTIVHPGGVATAIADQARPPRRSLKRSPRRSHIKRVLKLPPEAPEAAGETIIKGIEHRRRRVPAGGDARTIALVERLAPVSYPTVLGRPFGQT